MSSGVRVSVVVPVHNAEDHLVECLNGLVRQDLPAIEFLCIDDGSSDSSLSILRSYSKYDARFRVLTQANRGVGPTRNRGIEEARGAYVGFMDADDYYPDPATLRALWEGAERHEVEICGGSFSEDHGTWIRRSFEGIYTDYTFTRDGTMEYSDYQFDYGYHRFIYATRLLRAHGIVFPPYLRFQDPPFFVNAMARAGRFRALQRPTYCYRWGHQSLDWNHRRTYDLVCGLEANLATAHELGLKKLRHLTWSRLVQEYRERIVERLALGDEDTLQRVLACSQYAPDGLASQLTAMVAEATGASGGTARV